MKRFSKWLKRYFIPHTGNEFKPHFLREESIFFFFILIIVVELGFLVQVFFVFDKTSFLASVLPAILTDITNEERAQNDAPALIQNDLLTKAAQLKAEDMANKGYFAHTSPEGKTPWYWFSQVGYHFSSAGENLAVNFFESSDVANAWMNSPTHRANIVKKDYKEIGIGIASGTYKGQDTVFVAQLFGTPLAIETTPVLPTPKLSQTEVIATPKTAKPASPAVAINTPSVTTQPATPNTTEVLGEESLTTPAVAPQVAKAINTPSTFNLTISKALTSPREYRNYIFLGIAILLTFTVLLALFIKSEIKHPLVLARGVALIAVIVVLFILNVNLDELHLKTNVTTTDITANAISALEY